MKLVAAKCPNCGSNLEVNPNKETMKCEYCRSAILIEDAIAKYKLEISGEVEIKNLPKIENYMSLAQRSYDRHDYDKAYENYGKVLELDSNNPLALMRYGICKTLLNNYIDFSMEYLIKSFNEVQGLISEQENYDTEIEQFVLETVYATDESLYALRKYYNTYSVNGQDLLNIQTKLFSILLCYETVLEYTDDKFHIIEQIISVLRDLIRDKNYKTGSSREGGIFYETYRVNYGDKSKLTQKLNYYEKLLNPDSVEENIETETKKKQKRTPSDSKKMALVVVIDIFLGMLILGAALSLKFVSSLIMILMFLIITFENISVKLFKNDYKKRKICLIILTVILFITIVAGV